MSVQRSIPFRALQSSTIKDARNDKRDPNLETECIKRDQTGSKATFTVVVAKTALPPGYRAAVEKNPPATIHNPQPPPSDRTPRARTSQRYRRNGDDSRHAQLPQYQFEAFPDGNCFKFTEEDFSRLLRIAIEGMDAEAAAAAANSAEPGASYEVLNDAGSLEGEQDEDVARPYTDDILDVMYGFSEDGASIEGR